MAPQQKIIGILYPGELGTRIAEALIARGETVITTLQGRSLATRRRCEQSAITVRPTLSQVVSEADVVLSLVSPSAAAEVALDYASLAHLAPPDAVMVDLNSIGPALTVKLAGQVHRAGRSFVDGAINGLATRLGEGGTLFLSGQRAEEIARLFHGLTRVQVLGSDPGAASSMKMLLSGMSKGVCALFVELALAAHRQGMLQEMLSASAEIYPEVAHMVTRMLPTYAQHADRRAEEMRQLESTVREFGTEPAITSAVRRLHEQLAQVAWRQGAPTDVIAIVECLAKGQFQSSALPIASEVAAGCSFQE